MHTFKLVRSGATLFDFNNTGDSVASRWSPAPYDPTVKVVRDQLVLSLTGTSVSDFYDNVDVLFRALEDARFNYERAQQGLYYVPIFLQFKDEDSSYTLQTELLGYEQGEVENYITGALRARLIPNIPITLLRRPYFEETSEQTLYAENTVSNNGSAISLSAARGNLPAPLKISVKVGSANQDRVLIGAKSVGTLANFVCRREAESYVSRGTGVANLSDTDLSGDSGQQWTPPGTTEQELLTWTITSNEIDHMCTVRVLVRVRELSAVYNTKLRVRGGITTAGETNWGEYGDAPRFADGSYGGGDASAVGLTTALPLVDLGTLTFPPIDTNGIAPGTFALQLLGQATTSGASHKFDIDSIYLIPTMELPYGSGYLTVSVPEELGNDTNPIAIIDAADRTGKAYMDTSGTLQQVAADVRGKPLYTWAGKTVYLFIMTINGSNLRHREAVTNTVTVTCIPRYRFPGRGS